MKQSTWHPLQREHFDVGLILFGSDIVLLCSWREWTKWLGLRLHILYIKLTFSDASLLSPQDIFMVCMYLTYNRYIILEAIWDEFYFFSLVMSIACPYKLEFHFLFLSPHQGQYQILGTLGQATNSIALITIDKHRGIYQEKA